MPRAVAGRRLIAGSDVWLDVWRAEQDLDAATALEGVRLARRPRDAELFGEAGPDGGLRSATRHAEAVDGPPRWALHAYALRPGSCVQATFIGPSAPS
jgi:hypothetical protein